MSDDLKAQYEALRQDVLVPVAVKLEELIRDHVRGEKRVDRVSARAKSIESFLAKAARADTTGVPKYADPLKQIQDLIGARVIVFYLDDIEPMSEFLLRYFVPIETRTIVPDSEWEFGYFGKHHIVAVPSDSVPRDIALDAAPEFFELQVRTLFQHAWSEAEHDLGYKPLETLSADQKRRFAFTAAQAWGADRVFSELLHELRPT
jgi:putative GTP pyrophosphokinase